MSITTSTATAAAAARSLTTKRSAQAPRTSAKAAAGIAALAAIGPATWGTTYVTTTELLPPDRPLLAAALRALPAGLILLALTRRLPRGDWWWKAAVLGVLNFGAFFPLLFFGAYRLPGGVASTISAVMPLLVAGFGVGVLKVRPTRRTLIAGLVGVAGVALLVLRGSAAVDLAGIAAMLTATTLMALAVVLSKRWGRPEGVSLLTLTGWQLTVGGLILAPIALTAEGLPDHFTGANIAGYAYLGIIGTAIAYALWFRGIERLPASSVSFLGLTNPVVATLAGLLFLGQTLTVWQLAGLVLVVASVLLGQQRRATRRA
ncbi:EamA family transporter [Streptomyces formicae]|uniref:Permease of the drug/metabolite transporter (DMT) superfamily n=1 Tax=Streptomyces formicae TaxID=1616117 RepID=A0A291Q9H9_9ACTN|nr:EamA family transporter [Streptomyces formicae]ATL28135.1 Permease of the drug/metabolite transporter (DMT) superfamily [Streptomyces formicae]